MVGLQRVRRTRKAHRGVPDPGPARSLRRGSPPRHRRPHAARAAGGPAPERERGRLARAARRRALGRRASAHRRQDPPVTRLAAARGAERGNGTADCAHGVLETVRARLSLPGRARRARRGPLPAAGRGRVASRGETRSTRRRTCARPSRSGAGRRWSTLAHDVFARTEIARLDELRMTALEERIDADLVLGRHAELVGELEALVARHPLRERLRGQLMLALYRSGRQAERAARLPGRPQRRWPRSSGWSRGPACGSWSARSSSTIRRSRRRTGSDGPRAGRASPAALGGGRPCRDRRAGGLGPPGSATAAPRRPKTVCRRSAGGAPACSIRAPASSLADHPSWAPRPRASRWATGGVWVLDAEDKTISRIDANRRIPRADVQHRLDADRHRRRGGPRSGSATASAAGASPAPATRRASRGSIRCPATSRRPSPFPRRGSASTSRVAASTSTAHRGDQRRGLGDQRRPDGLPDRPAHAIAVVARVDGVQAEDIAADEGGAWVLGAGEVTKIDARTNRVATRIELAAESTTALAVGAGAVWVADALGGSIWRIDPGDNHVLRQIPLQPGVRSIAFGQGSLWATNEVTDKIYRVDPRTNARACRQPHGFGPAHRRRRRRRVGDGPGRARA